jgi:hypothetical protein
MKIDPQVVVDELINHLTAAVLIAPEVEKLLQRGEEDRFSRAGYQLLGAIPDGPAKLDFLCEITLQAEKQRTSFLVKVLGEASRESSGWKITQIYDIAVDPLESGDTGIPT